MSLMELLLQHNRNYMQQLHRYAVTSGAVVLAHLNALQAIPRPETDEHPV